MNKSGAAVEGAPDGQAAALQVTSEATSDEHLQPIADGVNTERRTHQKRKIVSLEKTVTREMS